MNGLAWNFSRTPENVAALSQKRLKLIQDGAIRDKLIKFPEIIAGRPLWTESDEPAKSFLELVKPYRDSLVHPSPFSTPERYGGLDKLEHLYRIDSAKARQAARVTMDVIETTFRHVGSHDVELPGWLQDLKVTLKAPGSVQR